MSLNKTGSDLVLDLLNAANLTDLSFEEIDFDYPETLIGDPNSKNTALQINALPLKGYTGEVSVKYNRVHLEDLTTLAPAVILIPEDGTLTDILEELNSLYSIQLIPSIDINPDVDLTGITSVPSIITLDAMESSYAFHGEVDVTVSFLNDDPGINGSYVFKNADTRSTSDRVMTAHLGFVIPSSNELYAFGYNSDGGSLSSRARYLKYSSSTNAFNGASTSELSYALNKRMAVVDGVGFCYTGSSVRYFNPATNTWISIASSAVPTTPVLYNVYLVECGGKLFLFSASTTEAGDSKASNVDIHRSYNISTNTWTEIANFKPNIDRFHSPTPPAFCSDGERYIYSVGGMCYTSGSSALQISGLYRYDTLLNVWFRYATTYNVPVILYYASAEYIDGFIYMFGGVTPTGVHNTNIYQFDTVALEWSIVGTFPARRNMVTGVTSDGNILTYGGIDTSDVIQHSVNLIY